MKKIPGHRFMKTVVGEEAHEEIEREGFKRITGTEDGRIFFIMPGGVLTDKGWEHDVTEAN